VRRGVSRIHIQFGSLKTDSDGEGGLVIDTATEHYTSNAVILTPSGNVDPAAFEVSTNVYHVTVSTQDEVTVNYLTVSSD
jgi:hypothetical protein